MMAAHLRRNISLFVSGNRLSPPFSPLSAARPSMGARSSSSLPSTLVQASKPANRLALQVAPSFLAALFFTYFHWTDFRGGRSGYERREAELASERRSHAEAAMVVLQRAVDELKNSQSYDFLGCRSKVEDVRIEMKIQEKLKRLYREEKKSEDAYVEMLDREVNALKEKLSEREIGLLDMFTYEREIAALIAEIEFKKQKSRD